MFFFLSFALITKKQLFRNTDLAAGFELEAAPVICINVEVIYCMLVMLVYCVMHQ